MNKPIKELETGLLKITKTDYDTIDQLMRGIGKKYNINMKDLHNSFVDKHKESPDSWIKRKRGLETKKIKSCGCSKTKKTFEEFILEASAAWQRKEGQNPSGGLNKKGRESYPGDLKAPVTTEPSKLKKGSESWNRRHSFCSRMSGMKKKLTSAKTAKDPNSRINKSLRKWNC